MPKHPEHTVAITNQIDATRLILQCLHIFIINNMQNEGEQFILDVNDMGLEPAIRKWFSVEQED